MVDTADIDTAEITGAVVVDRLGHRLSRVERVHLSEDGRQPLFVAVRLHPDGTSTLVPLQGARLRGGVLHLVFDREAVEGAPVVKDPCSEEERASVLDWFDGRAGGVPSGVGSAPAGFEDAPGPGADVEDPDDAWKD